jgi:type III restriction enzyme
MSMEVETPIISSPFEEPAEHWYIQPGETPVRKPGRRPAMVFQPRNVTENWDTDGQLQKLPDYENAFELPLVNLIRERVKQWRSAGYPGASRTTLDLLGWWRRDGRQWRLFFTQLEAVETIVFLMEARSDFRQGIQIPSDIGSGDSASFVRYACKMATGAGKTTVMGMLAAWSILNKVNDRVDARFSDVVLIVCPNITIRSRLRELDPAEGDASLYRTRDLVPPHMMPLIARGNVLITNWHVFEPQETTVGDTNARVNKSGVRQPRFEKILIGAKTTTMRGRRYLTQAEFERQVNAGIVQVTGEPELNPDGSIKSVRVASERYVESDAAVLARVLGRDIGGKKNILVFNDEAHHAYRIHQDDKDESRDEIGDEDETEEFKREATVWIEGLDRVSRMRGINFCVDLSATPYYLASAGRDTGRPFPWVVSDFGLIDAIESGLVKIPQLPSRDVGGGDRAQYFNLWDWIMRRLSAAERGGKKGTVKPEAVLKHAHTPIEMLAGDWVEERERWSAREDTRTPVFILVCKDTRLAKVVYEWIADGTCPTGVPQLNVPAFRNDGNEINTIRVDTKAVDDSDAKGAKGDQVRWMRFTLDTVGKRDWPTDREKRPIYPDGFEELAIKLEKPLHPPGRDIRCIVSVAMLTEGWDATTVTHIVGLRPFMSQLLCEQVVGRGLRRVSYDVGDDGKFGEEIAQVMGVPFDVIPFKATGTPTAPKVKRFHVHALPDRKKLEIRFPRVEGYIQTIKSRVTVDWDAIAPLQMHPDRIPPGTEMTGLMYDSHGAPALLAPGRAREITLDAYRSRTRVQQIVYDLARDLTRNFCERSPDVGRPFILFPQMREIADRYLREKIVVVDPNDLRDVGCAPYYGLILETLLAAVQPDSSAGEAPELPRYEALKPEGSTADVDYWTSKDVRPTTKSHVNYVVADTVKWEQQAAYRIDSHARVEAFVKNAGLGFTIPYLHDGQPHDYVPDFIVRFNTSGPEYLILETKGYDDLEDVKRQAAERWVAAVNADGKYGTWRYSVAKKMEDVSYILSEI